MRRLLLAAALVALGACDDGATNVVVDPIVPPTLRLEVSGGIAATDYAYDVTEGRFVVGARCAHLCDFAAGDTLHVLSDLQRALLSTALVDLGGTAVDHDYGVPCCDQFGYRLTISDGPTSVVVEGAMSTLPGPYGRLITLLELLHRGIVPIVVDDAIASGAPRDPVDILDAKLDAPILELTVRYGGGCARHDFDLVVASGWRESYPVQVDVDLAHAGHDDPCDALPTETVRFDLTPLREAYAASYGSGAGALAIQLGAASGGSRRTVTWNF